MMHDTLVWNTWKKKRKPERAIKNRESVEILREIRMGKEEKTSNAKLTKIPKKGL